MTKSLSRRRFLELGAAGLAGMGLLGCGYERRSDSGLLVPLGAGAPEEAPGEAPPRRFYVAFLADTHVTDVYYEGREGNALDTETVRMTPQRLAAVRDTLNALPYPIEAIFVAGDTIHNLPFASWDEYMGASDDRFDVAAELFGGFAGRVYPGYGNHDYRLDYGRELSHDLYRHHFGVEPYYSVDLHGWKFIHANNQIGETWTRGSASYETSIGSFGREQLDWIEGELQQGMPTFLFCHFPLWIIASVEQADFGLPALLRRYQDTIRLVVTGHSHMWFHNTDMFGPRSLVMGSTRYDTDAFMLVEIDTELGTWRCLNWDCFHWGTLYARTWEPPVA